MTDEGQDLLKLVLCKGSNGNRVAVDLESFLLFNSEIDHALEALVDRWADFMTPESMRLEDDELVR